MRQIGLVGGLSWVSTAEYYRLVNTMVRDHLGGHRSARVLLDSVDEQDFLDAQTADPSEAGCQAMMVDSVAAVVAAAGIERMALLGVAATMDGSFYPRALARHGIETLVPGTDERAYVHQVIVDAALAP